MLYNYLSLSIHQNCRHGHNFRIGWDSIDVLKLQKDRLSLGIYGSNYIGIYFNTSALNVVENDFLLGATFTNNNFNKNVSQKAIKANTNRIMCVAMASLRLGLFRGRPIFVPVLESAYFRRSAYFRGNTVVWMEGLSDIGSNPICDESSIL